MVTKAGDIRRHLEIRRSSADIQISVQLDRKRNSNEEITGAAEPGKADEIRLH